MDDGKRKKNMAETLYRVNVSPLPVMPSFDKDLIMKRIEDPPFEADKSKDADKSKKEKSS